MAGKKRDKPENRAQPYFAKIVELSPPSHQSASIEQGDTGRAGVVEEMLATTGFDVIEGGTV
jgi:hypothetical protein